MNLHFTFFGTDDFSVIVLRELKNAGFLPALVITQPDHPKGRGLALTPPPAKLWALKNKIPILQPETLDSALNLQLTTYNLQLFIVASYGLILPQHILDIPARGTLNIHPSLLPKYRGATPIESQILAGEKEIGVTIILVDEKMDHGPLLGQREFPISNFQFPNNNQNTNVQMPKASELRKRLAEEGGKLLAEVMQKWVAGEIKAVPQDENKASYTKKLTKVDGEINLVGDPCLAEAERRRRAYQNFLKIRAFEGGIGTYFYYSLSSPFQGEVPSVRGGGVSAAADGVVGVAGGMLQPPKAAPFIKGDKIRVKITDADFRDGKLLITRVIPEGKREMSYEGFLRGLK